MAHNTPPKGSLAILYGGTNSVYLMRLDSDFVVQTSRGLVSGRDCINKEFGTKISVGKNDGWMTILPPHPSLVTLALVHNTQILYRADISLITLLLDAKPGDTIVEAGTGSGSMSYTLSKLVSPNGKIISFDFHEKRCEEARDLVKALGQEIIKIENRDITEKGFIIPQVLDKEQANSLFLDIPSPWNAISHTYDILRPLGRCVSFSPCIEQVQRSTIAFKIYGFEDIRTFEILCKPWGINTETEETTNSYQIPYYSHTGYITLAIKSKS